MKVMETPTAELGLVINQMNRQCTLNDTLAEEEGRIGWTADGELCSAEIRVHFGRIQTNSPPTIACRLLSTNTTLRYSPTVDCILSISLDTPTFEFDVTAPPPSVSFEIENPEAVAYNYSLNEDVIADIRLGHSPDPCQRHCIPFMNWSEKKRETHIEKAVVFRSFVATVKLQPALHDNLKAKAVKFLESVEPKDKDSAKAFLNKFGRTTDESSTSFIQSILVLISSPNQIITSATMDMLQRLLQNCSTEILLFLVKADLVPQLVTTLNPLSLSFAEAVDIHTYLLSTIGRSLCLATPDGLRQLAIKERNGQQSVRETILKQVLVPSEKYVCHLCLNRFSIVDGDQSCYFLYVLAQFLRISPYHEPTMDFVHPVHTSVKFSNREIFISQQQNLINVSIVPRWERLEETTTGELDLFGEMQFAIKTGQSIDAKTEMAPCQLVHTFELNESVADCTSMKTPKSDAGDTPPTSSSTPKSATPSSPTLSEPIVVDTDHIASSWYLDEAEINSERINTAALKLADATSTLYVDCIEKLKPEFDSSGYMFFFTSVNSFIQISDI
ncbi:hypothetical protein BLNAU_6848 [Blattamonas nauphoetae]|uniref:Uncharacterized protein n=1 Tax=Blattamonas nauphoetae TaxID=2049346 RepID=A0ABQ9Y356_9EUKA|nr:hypothetical protein BLNAU_6848 [Blattamonas nauphoetae]